MSIEQLLKIVSPTFTDKEGAIVWSEQLNLLELLDEQRVGSTVMLYGSSFNTGNLLLHSILVPAQDIENIAMEDFTSWEGNPFDSWTCGLVWGGERPARVKFDEHLFRIGTKALRNGRQLIFGRSFEGRTEDKRYFEIAQLLTHSHGLLKLTPFHGHLIVLAEGVRSEQTAYPQAAVSGAIS